MSIKAPSQTETSTVIQEFEGNLFNAPENAVLIHACNCVGSWGAGIAKAFKIKYPAAYKAHVQFSKSKSIDDLIGTCQLIPPQETDFRALKSPGSRSRSDNPPAERKRHWIACLFTSRGYGKPTKTRPGKDEPDVILENTVKSLVDFKGQLQQLWGEVEVGEGKEGSKGEDGPGELWSCRFNSGLFAVDWKDTKEVMESLLSDLGRPVKVFRPGQS